MPRLPALIGEMHGADPGCARVSGRAANPDLLMADRARRQHSGADPKRRFDGHAAHDQHRVALTRRSWRVSAASHSDSRVPLHSESKSAGYGRPEATQLPIYVSIFDNHRFIFYNLFQGILAEP